MSRSFFLGILGFLISLQNLEAQNPRPRPRSAEISGSNWRNKPVDLAPEEINQTRKVRRLLRGSLFDDRTGAKKALDVSASGSAVAVEGHSSGFPQRLPPLPITESDAVVVGTLASFQAYLSNDRTSIYHEIDVSLSQILADKRGVLHPAQGVTLVGGGGAIRLPDGRILRKFMPPAAENDVEIGRKYVLFLKYLPEGDWFVVMKAWELRDGRVIPKAWSDIGDSQSGKSPYTGMDESVFVEAVRRAIQVATY